MRYMKADWFHQDPDDPILYYCEIGEDGYETRKIEVYRDGRMAVANQYEDEDPDGEAWLATVVIPPIEEIDEDPQFRAVEIQTSEFEDMWEKALYH